MTSSLDEERESHRENRREEASAWFAFMGGPDVEAHRHEFEAWKLVPGNAAAYREMEAIWTAAGKASPAAIRRRPAYLGPGLIAAGVAAALTIGFLVLRDGPAGETAAIATYSSERGKIETFRLADGSRVTLDTGSRMSVDLKGDERRVELISGRARFFVAHDSSHPFVVSVGDNAVVARGTTFDVRAGPAGAEVALIEGAVDLERRERAASPRLVGHLSPGQKAVFGANDSAPKVGPARVDAWTAGLRSGADIRLADVVAEANRYGSSRIVLADPAIGDLRLSGGFRPADTKDLVDGLAAAFDLAVARSPAGDIVLSRKPSLPVSYLAPCASIGVVRAGRASMETSSMERALSGNDCPRAATG